MPVQEHQGKSNLLALELRWVYQKCVSPDRKTTDSRSTKHTHVLDLDNAFSISTRELRENIEGKNDTIASVLNELAGQGRLRRSRKAKQRVLWSLVNEEIPGRSPSRQESLETGSQNRFPTRTEKQNGNRYKFNQYKWL